MEHDGADEQAQRSKSVIRCVRLFGVTVDRFYTACPVQPGGCVRMKNVPISIRIQFFPIEASISENKGVSIGTRSRVLKSSRTASSHKTFPHTRVPRFPT